MIELNVVGDEHVLDRHEVEFSPNLMLYEFQESARKAYVERNRTIRERTVATLVGRALTGLELSRDGHIRYNDFSAAIEGLYRVDEDQWTETLGQLAAIGIGGYFYSVVAENRIIYDRLRVTSFAGTQYRLPLLAAR